jgi:hypothetical protein
MHCMEKQFFSPSKRLSVDYFFSKPDLKISENPAGFKPPHNLRKPCRLRWSNIKNFYFENNGRVRLMDNSKCLSTP